MALIGIKVRRGVVTENQVSKLSDWLGVPVILVMDQGDVEPIFDNSETLQKILSCLESIDAKLSADGENNLWVRLAPGP